MLSIRQRIETLENLTGQDAGETWLTFFVAVQHGKKCPAKRDRDDECIGLPKCYGSEKVPSHLVIVRPGGSTDIFSKKEFEKYCKKESISVSLQKEIIRRMNWIQFPYGFSDEMQDAIKLIS